MNIYCELQLDRIRVKIDGEELAFQVTTGYYTNRMLAGSGISTRIHGYIRYHESDMNIFEKVKHRISRNNVFILVNQEVQQHVTLRQIHEFAVRVLGGGSVYIIPKPTTFDSTELENINSIRTEYIKGSPNRDTVLSQLTNLTQRPAFK